MVKAEPIKAAHVLWYNTQFFRYVDRSVNRQIFTVFPTYPKRFHSCKNDRQSRIAIDLSMSTFERQTIEGISNALLVPFRMISI